MFSQHDDSIVSYHYGNNRLSQPSYLPFTLKQKASNNILLSAFTVVRGNCEDACSQKILADVSDELKQEYKDNSKIAQISLKSKNDSIQKGLDGCIRRCFVKKMTNHFGKEVQDYIYASAFEYQQQDFHYFEINDMHKQARTKKLTFPESDFVVNEKIMNSYSA